jgi:L-2-aminoadipate reductase
MFSVFMPLRKMPLTPNGKIDKPALPFPDTAHFGASLSLETNQNLLTPTQRTISKIWSRLLPHAFSNSIPLDQSFFDLGGHSILATRLIFELRKGCGVDVPLGLVFSEPTIRGQAREIESLIKADLNIDSGYLEKEYVNKKEITNNLRKNGAGAGAGEIYSSTKMNNNTTDSVTTTTKSSPNASPFYFEDLVSLISQLPSSYPPLPSFHPRNVYFVTGVTGFLGAFILSALLESCPNTHIIAHVRAADKNSGLERVRKNCSAHLVWKEEWVTDGKIEIAPGDLEKDRLGLEEDAWKRYCEIVDVIVHNGALVRIGGKERVGYGYNEKIP